MRTNLDSPEFKDYSFEIRIDKDSGHIVSEDLGACWVWIGAHDSYGYGRFTYLGERIQAHRYSYIKYIGPIKKIDNILHRCDFPPCVNPKHLRLGTKRDNLLDALTKKRHFVPTPPKGEKHSHARLTNIQIIKIRERYSNGDSVKDISKDFSINQSTISRIVNRRTWNHI
jgi:hypothetical protein